jgi:hypothetical protein
MPRARPTREAWFITGPGPDERLGSVVDRAASLYGTTGECLLGELIGEGEVGIGDVDCGGAAVVASIARAIQIAPRDLWQHRLQDHPSLLAPSARLAFCPACWQEDRAAGREPGLRREWSGVLRTMCARHAEPRRCCRDGAIILRRTTARHASPRSTTSAAHSKARFSSGGHGLMAGPYHLSGFARSYWPSASISARSTRFRP